jgi:iron-sulfur cluster assembly protein
MSTQNRMVSRCGLVAANQGGDREVCALDDLGKLSAGPDEGRATVLTLTDDAIDYITHAVKAKHLPEEAGLRISARRDARPAGSLAAELVTGPESDDQVVQFEGARVFLDPGASTQLGGKVLDARVQPGGVAFALTEQ